MKLIIQKAVKASVTVDGELVNSIGKGLCVLVGIHRDDTNEDVDYLVHKLLNVRLFESPDGRKWDRSVSSESHEILCVSQFTLYQELKGNKPDFRKAMVGSDSKILYQNFIEGLRKAHGQERVKDGIFGAYMVVDISNDGPVTIELLSKSSKKDQSSKP